MSTDTLKLTVLNVNWLLENTELIRSWFPETWTHVNNIEMLPLMYKMKLSGIDFSSDEELALCLAQFERNNIILRDNHLIRRGNANLKKSWNPFRRS